MPPHCSRIRRQGLLSTLVGGCQRVSSMRRVLLTAVAAAPLLALIGGAAFAACPAAGTGTATGGADITTGTSCTITPKNGGTPPANPNTAGAGLILNSSNNITVVTGTTISNTDVSNTVGI